MAVSAIAADTRYQAFGTAISSEIPLPLPLANDATETPAWSIVRGDRDAAYVQGEMIAEDCCHAECHNGQVINRTYRGEDDTWIRFAISACATSALPIGRSPSMRTQAPTINTSVWF